MERVGLGAADTYGRDSWVPVVSLPGCVLVCTWQEWFLASHCQIWSNCPVYTFPGDCPILGGLGVFFRGNSRFVQESDAIVALHLHIWSSSHCSSMHSSGIDALSSTWLAGIGPAFYMVFKLTTTVSSLLEMMASSWFPESSWETGMKTLIPLESLRVLSVKQDSRVEWWESENTDR